MNYDVLTSAITAAAEVDSTEFNAYIPVAIDIAQERLTRDLDVHGLTAYTTITVAAGDAFVQRPENARIIKHLYRVDDAGQRHALYLRTDEFINDYWPIRASTSTPLFYAKWGFSQFLLGPTPTSAGVLEASYVVRPTAVSAGHLDNWFTLYASNALFYASMAEMTKFMKNPSAVATWEQNYQAELLGLLREAKRDRRDDQLEPLAPQKSNNFDGIKN